MTVFLFVELAFDGKVIVVSGYDDFDYAREALRYGVVEFLLKPVELADLKKAAAKSMTLIAHEERQLSKLSLVEDAMPTLREQLQQQLIGLSGQLPRE